MTVTAECLDEGAILDFVRGSLSDSGFREAEGHLARCSACRELVSAVFATATGQRAARAPRSDPALSETVPAIPPDGAATGAPTDARFGDGETRHALAPVAPGELVAGKYRIERVLGAGGMGIVVSATHIHLGQRVALKFLRDLGAPAAEASGRVVRFLREGRAAAKMQGEHVARVMDVGTLEGGAPYLVIEFLQGADFAALLAQRGPLPVDEVLHHVLQACEAIAEAHALGIVHRDLKPANLFLSARPDGSPLVKVLDFGISKERGALAPQLTSGEVVIGSPRYMSPEQILTPRDVDARADIWALGVILYELLTGNPPFDSDSAAGLSARIVSQDAPKLRKARPDMSSSLEAVVARCLKKDRAHRFADVAELAEAIFGLLRAGPHLAGARVSVDRIVRLARAGTVQIDHGVAVAPQKRTSAPLRAMAMASTVAVLGAGVWWMERRAPSARPETSSSERLATSSSAATAPIAPAAPAPVPAPHAPPEAATLDAGSPKMSTEPPRTKPARSKPRREATAPAQSETDTNQSGLLDRQ
ncbi:serine/threonine-protein kinase [Pendulispora albinea]|uniref:Serine/threonine protein kinase n=1 Tax=Pendulispora albinea TaxID=2741071 RepID=A0ABZ2M6W8_9BACT